MKRLSDYKDGDAIELWADLLEPMGRIIQDDVVKHKIQKEGTTALDIAQAIMKTHPKDAAELLTRIDPTPITGMNIIVRLVALFQEIIADEDMKSFFGFAETQTGGEFSGSATANTEDAEA